jgi:hypothetical protein
MAGARSSHCRRSSKPPAVCCSGHSNFAFFSATLDLVDLASDVGDPLSLFVNPPSARPRQDSTDGATSGATSILAAGLLVLFHAGVSPEP